MIQDLENEIWKPIVGFESLYEVSNMGRVKSLSRKINCNGYIKITEDKIMKPNENEKGYLKIIFSKNGKYRKFAVHRLVLIAFTSYEGKEVNHKEGVKSDNRLSMIEWSTRSENIKHMYQVLGVKSNSPFKKGVDHIFYTKGYKIHNTTKIKCDTLDIEFNSQREAESKLGLWRGSVCDMLKGRINHVNGMVFRYI